MPNNLFAVIEECLAERSPADKVMLTQQALQAWHDGRLDCVSLTAVLPIGEPGRPELPRLVLPREVPKRALGTAIGQAALIHAITHIEFNAINLALDAAYRFRDMPRDFYRDWLTVAGEEAYHFSLLCTRLGTLGYAYGDFAAHDGLWEMAQETAYDVLVRMALVPRVLEARGLDATPKIIARLQAIGDQQTSEILAIILRDEIGHVAIGTHWFHYLCRQRGLEPRATSRQLLTLHLRGQVRGPFHRAARLQAGFTEQEMDELEGLMEE